MPKISGILRLAWRSLGLLSIMSFAGSCIVADPPEYRAPGQTRPVLNMYSAVPTQTQALVIDASLAVRPSIDFSVQVRSEDAGEDLRGVFFIDYQMPGEDALRLMRLDPSTYDNVGRYFKFPWPPGKVRGCHFLTLVVAHTSTFQVNDQWHLDPRFADNDAALATWTVNVLNSPADETTLSSCPAREGPVVP
jgi:hypothetical protein